jgi:hypothetical protein
MTTDTARQQVLRLLDGGGAHMTFEEAIADFPDDAVNVEPPSVPYTPWQLVEHLRLTQRDMLDYVISADYPRLDWPADYWPARASTASRDQWLASVRGFVEDRTRLGSLVEDPQRDLDAPLAWAPAHTLLRCVRIIGNHNSYHVGELAILRQVMAAWPPDHD